MKTLLASMVKKSSVGLFAWPDWSEGSFVRETAYSLISVALYAGQQWLVVKILLVYSGLEATGWYGYLLGWITPLFTLANANLRGVLLADFGDRARPASVYIQTRFSSTLLACGVGALAGWLFLKPSMAGGVGFAVFLFLFRAVDSMSDLAQGFFQRSHCMRQVMLVQGLRIGVGMPFFWLGVDRYHDPMAGFALLALSSAAISYLIEWRWLRRRILATELFSAHSARECCSLWWYAAPLGLGLFVASFQQSVPRLMLKTAVDLQELGVFYSLGYLVVLGGFVASSIGMAAAPRLGKLVSSGKGKIANTFLHRLLAVDAALIFILWVLFDRWGDSLIGILLDKKVTDYMRYIPLALLVGLLAFWDAHIGTAVTACKIYRGQMLLQVAKLGVTVPLSYFLVTSYGIGGAFIGIAVANALSIAGLYCLWRAGLRKAQAADF